MSGKVFVDSNIWVYLFTERDSSKGIEARSFLDELFKDNEAVVSYQVVVEVGSVLKKKGLDESTIRRATRELLNLTEVITWTSELTMLASNLRELFSLSYWDSLIAASAVNAGCTSIASEDMQHGLSIYGTTIQNVFTTNSSQRTGFMAGKVKIPDDFDNMNSSEIREMFEDKKEIDHANSKTDSTARRV